MSKLKEIRFFKKISQFKLVNMARVHQSRISLIENGLVEATEDEKKKLGQALGVSVDEIFPEAKAIPASGKNNRERRVAVG